MTAMGTEVVWVHDSRPVALLAAPTASRNGVEGFTLISDSRSYTKDLNAKNGITGFRSVWILSARPK